MENDGGGGDDTFSTTFSDDSDEAKDILGAIVHPQKAPIITADLVVDLKTSRRLIVVVVVVVCGC